MRETIKKHPLILFYGLALGGMFAINFIMMILLSSVPNYFSVFTQWSPALAAIVIISIQNGKFEIYSVAIKTSIRLRYLQWYIIAFIIPIIFCGMSYILLLIIETPQWNEIKYNIHNENYFFYLLVMLFGCYGEEIGWRGFMLPLLRRKYSLLLSSSIVGLCWGLWHLYFNAGFYVFVVYMIMVTEISFIISWLCTKTQNNIMVAIIFHTSFNFFSFAFFERIIFTEIENNQSILLLYGTLTMLFFIPCIFIIKDMLIEQNFKTKK